MAGGGCGWGISWYEQDVRRGSGCPVPGCIARPGGGRHRGLCRRDSGHRQPGLPGVEPVDGWGRPHGGDPSRRVQDRPVLGSRVGRGLDHRDPPRLLPGSTRLLDGGPPAMGLDRLSGGTAGGTLHRRPGRSAVAGPARRPHPRLVDLQDGGGPVAPQVLVSHRGWIGRRHLARDGDVAPGHPQHHQMPMARRSCRGPRERRGRGRSVGDPGSADRGRPTGRAPCHQVGRVDRPELVGRRWPQRTSGALRPEPFLTRRCLRWHRHLRLGWRHPVGVGLARGAAVVAVGPHRRASTT
jgi:hypothetical protein